MPHAISIILIIITIIIIIKMFISMLLLFVASAAAGNRCAANLCNVAVQGGCAVRLRAMWLRSVVFVTKF